jgi:hypothetical protein
VCYLKEGQYRSSTPTITPTASRLTVAAVARERSSAEQPATRSTQRGQRPLGWWVGGCVDCVCVARLRVCVCASEIGVGGVRCGQTVARVLRNEHAERTPSAREAAAWQPCPDASRTLALHDHKREGDTPHTSHAPR